MKKTKLAFSIAIIVCGILIILFSPSVYRLILHIGHLYGSANLFGHVIATLTALGSVLIVIGIIYILFRKD